MQQGGGGRMVEPRARRLRRLAAELCTAPERVQGWGGVGLACTEGSPLGELALDLEKFEADGVRLPRTTLSS